MSLHQMMSNIKTMDSSIERFLDDSKQEVLKLDGKVLTSEPCIIEDGWLVRIFYLKTDSSTDFIFTCVNEEESLAYAITSANQSCPDFLVHMAQAMYQLIPNTTH